MRGSWLISVVLVLAAAGCATTPAPPVTPGPPQDAVLPLVPFPDATLAPPAETLLPGFPLRGGPKLDADPGAARYVKRFDLRDGNFSVVFYEVRGDSVRYTMYSSYPPEGVKDVKSYEIRDGRFYIGNASNWCRAIELGTDDCGLQATVSEDAITFTRVAGGKRSGNQNSYAGQNISSVPRLK